MDEKKRKRKIRYRKIRNDIAACVPRLILWGISLCSLGEMLFCVWACMEKYRPQAAVVAGLEFVCFLGAGAGLLACRVPMKKIKDKAAVIVENDSPFFGEVCFLAAVSMAFSFLTVASAMGEMWDGIAVMGTLEGLGKLYTPFYMAACHNQRIIFLSDGTLLRSSITGRVRKIRVSQIGKLEVSISSGRAYDTYTIRAMDREGKKLFVFDNTMENYDILYGKLEELSIPIEGRTWTKRGISLEELFERKYLYARETEDSKRQQMQAEALKKPVWILAVLTVACCVLSHFVFPSWIPRKYCLFLASLFPMGNYLLMLIFPKIIVADTPWRVDASWVRRYVQLPLESILLPLFNSIGIFYFIAVDYYIADAWKVVAFCGGTALVFMVPVLLRMPKILRNPNHILSASVSAASVGVGLALAITFLSMGREAIYPAQIADAWIKRTESRAIYYVEVRLRDGKKVKVDTTTNNYAAASHGRALVIKEWEGVFGIRFFNLYEEE